MFPILWNQRFIIVFARVLHRTTSCNSCFQFTHSYFYKNYFNIIIPYRPSGFPTTTSFGLIYDPVHATCSAYLITHTFITEIMLDKTTNSRVPHYGNFSIFMLRPLRSKYSSQRSTLCYPQYKFLPSE
jgi:hypothetical protein